MPIDETADPILLTQQDAADTLSISLRTLQNIIERGELATVSIGRYRRVRRSDLLAYVDQLSSK